jgi:hypothetical protein
LKLEARTPIYVTKDITAEGDISLVDGQTIVIADQAYADVQSRPNGISASFGTVDALVTLTIPVGKKLTVASGAAVVVGNPTETAKNGVLKIAGGAKLTVNGGATLAVTTESHVLVEKVSGSPANALADSGLTLFTGAKLAFFGITDGSSEVDPIQLVTTGGSADTARIAIETDAEGKSAPAAIAPDIEVYDSYDVASGTDETNNITEDAQDFIANKVAEIEAVSPARITASASEAKNLLDESTNSVTTVTYTGNETSLGAITATDKTLVIAGTVSAQAAAISVGTLEVTSSGELTTTTSGTITVTTALTNEGTIDLGTDGTIAVTGSGTVTNNGTIKTATALPATGVTNNGVIESTATTEAVLKTHVGASGTGKVVLTGAVNGSGVTAPLALTQNLEIGADGSITYTGTATTAFSATTAKTVKLLADDTSPGKLTLPASITGFGTNVTVTNNGLISTATESGATLNALIAKAGGKIEASGSDVKVAATDILSISKGTILTIVNSGKLTIEDDAELYIAAGAEVIVEGTLVNANGSGGDLIGTITIKSTGTVKDLNNGGGSLWGTNGSGKYVIEKGAEMYRETESGLVISGEANGGAGVPLHLLYLESGTLTMTKTAYVLDGNLTSYGLDLGGTNHTVFQLYDNLTITIKAGKTLTITDFASSHGKDALWVYNNAWILGETGASVEITSTTHNDISIAYIAPPETYNEPKATHPDVTADSAPDNFNFYKTDSTEKAVLIYPGYNDYVDSGWGPYDMYRVAGGTYNWDATAGGTGKAGWKKEAVE